MRRRHLARLLAVASAAVVLAGCGTTISGKAVSVFDDPFKVGGLQAVDGASGLRSDAEKPTRKVLHSDGGKDDEIGAQSVSDLESFWKDNYAGSFDGEFRPVKDLISWDSNEYDGEFCGDTTSDLINAGFCEDDNTIGWDRGVLLPALRKANGDMAITMVLAHEYGHAIQKMAKLNKKGTPTLVAEQQADCLAGVYIRWVAEGNSKRFTLSTGDGLNNLLAAMISFRDPLLSQDDYADGGDEHGSAFERISAFQTGFTDGPSSCAAIDAQEIGQRRETCRSNCSATRPVSGRSARSRSARSSRR